MIVNMGQNLTAVPRIEFEALEGTKVTLRFAEMLNDGSSAGNGATQADGPKGRFTRKVSEVHVLWQPISFRAMEERLISQVCLSLDISMCRLQPVMISKYILCVQRQFPL